MSTPPEREQVRPAGLLGSTVAATLAEQVGVGRSATAALSTGELCARVGDRMARSARPGPQRKGRMLLPTRESAAGAPCADPVLGLPAAVLHLLAELEACDPAGPGRAHVVAQYATAIGATLAPADEIARIRDAALLCNIGLTAVPRAILQKAGPLDPRERQLVRRHPICGAEILHEIPALRALSPLVLHHHEAYDGNGYPYRLSREWIPLGARIIRVAETHEALLRAQPYRPAMAPAEALAVLRAGSGEQFDPACIDALAAWLERGAPPDPILTRWWATRQIVVR